MSVEIIGAIGAVAGAALLGAMSPGPSTLFVARSGLNGRMRHGTSAAFAMALGFYALAPLRFAGYTQSCRRFLYFMAPLKPVVVPICFTLPGKYPGALGPNRARAVVIGR